MSIRVWAVVFGLAAVSPASADGLAVGDVPGAANCGGDAYSTAQVVEGHRARRGPIESVPQTLCADLAPQRPADLRIEAYPLIAPSIGERRHRAPYGGSQR